MATVLKQEISGTSSFLSKFSKQQLEERGIKQKNYRKGYWNNLSIEKKKGVGERVMATWNIKRELGDRL